jgi:6-phosphogluconolactonase
MNTNFKRSLLAACLTAALPCAALAMDYGDRGFRGDDSADETLYTLSNDAGANQVLAFRADREGHMKPAGQYATGGTGTGAGLGNQGALAFSEDASYLFAVNAGSNDISVFRAGSKGLRLIDREAEVGTTPVSITVANNLVYVVNSGDDSIAGYTFNPRSGRLRALPGSHRKLSGAGTGAAQISFDRDGDSLVVTEKATNKITTFALNRYGIPVAQHVIDSAGQTPFGFAFGKRDQFFVSEAQGGASNAATVSSYQLKPDATAKLIDGVAATGQTAACWLATTPNGRVAFTADTPANAISSFAIDAAGHLKLLESQAAEAQKPTDLAISKDGQLLYSLNGGDHTIGVYTISGRGTLDKMESVKGLPAGATGLVVR